MAVVVGQPVPGLGARSAPWWVPVLGGALALVGLGALGWILPGPGRSLVVPAVVVLGVGVALALASWAVSRARWSTGWPVAAAVTGAAVAATVWTFEFSLPASMAWDPGATRSAAAVLFDLNHGDLARTVPPTPCRTVRTGSVGPLGAPYTACAVSTAEGHFVVYTALGSRPVRGLAYTDVGAATFPDGCTRHLAGRWWAFVGSTENEALGIDGLCPFGYRFHGGG